MLVLNPYPDMPLPSPADFSSIDANPQTLDNLDVFSEMRRFFPEEIGKIPPESARQSAEALAARILASGLDPALSAETLIPSAGRILAMLIDDRDSEEYQDLSGISYPAELEYKRIASMHVAMASLRSRYSALFSAIYSILQSVAPAIPPTWIERDADKWNGDLTLPRLFSFPRPQDLDYSHTFALDIFLLDVEYLSGDIQRGPYIHSISDGLVVATGIDWLGFPRESQALSFIHGGISPKSGNGVIVYSPSENRYYLYFHLYDVKVAKGQLVSRGQPLGHGGNSGINARKKGGGDHLHLEIFDASKEKYLRNTDIIALLRASAKRKPAFSPR